MVIKKSGIKKAASSAAFYGMLFYLVSQIYAISRAS